jgi:gluconate kinase
MPTSLLDSQLDTLELGDDVTVVDNDQPEDEVVAGILARR